MNYEMPDMPKGVEEGILKGIYPFKTLKSKQAKSMVNILASGSLVNEAIKAQKELMDTYSIGSTIWCVTNYKHLREESLEADRHNLLYPKRRRRRNLIYKKL